MKITLEINSLTSSNNAIGWYKTKPTTIPSIKLNFQKSFKSATGMELNSVQITDIKLIMNFLSAGRNRQKTFKFGFGNKYIEKTTAGKAYGTETYVDFTSDLSDILSWLGGSSLAIIIEEPTPNETYEASDGTTKYSANFSRLVTDSTTAATLELTYEIKAGSASIKHNTDYILGNSGTFSIQGLGSNNATITLSYSSTTQNIVSHTTNSLITFTPSLSDFGPFLNAETTSLPATLKIQTYNGSTSLGSKSYTINLKTANNSNFQPSISTINIGGEKLILDSIYAANHSEVQFTATCSTKYNATIASYKWIFPDGSTLETTDNTCTKIFTSAFEEKAVNLIVTDSRGYSTSENSSTFTIYSYNKPSITTFNVSRADNNGIANDSGTKLKVFSLVVSYTNKISDYSNNYTETYKVRGQEVLKDPNGLLITDEIKVDESAEVEVIIEDSLGNTISRIINVPAFAYLLHFGRNKNSIGIGTAAENLKEGEEGKISIGWPLSLKAPLSRENGGTGVSTELGLKELIHNYMYPVGAIYLTTINDESNSNLPLSGDWEFIGTDIISNKTCYFWYRKS